MAFIIYDQGCYARFIPRVLKVSSIFPNERIKSDRRNDMSIHVNWGCGPRQIAALNIKPEIPIFNMNISGSVLKMRTFELLDAAGLPHPRVVRDPKELIDGTPFYMRGKYLGRKDGLSGGEGITIYEKGTLPADGVKHDFYSQVVSKAHEVRLHVARDIHNEPQVICEQFKYIPVGSKVLIRNWDNGARFSARPLHTRMPEVQANEARRIAKEALTACHLDFAAFDLALTKKGNWVIFEANSAPGITEREEVVDADDGNDAPCSYDAYLNHFRQFVIERPIVRKKIHPKRVVRR